ncbi:MAG: PilZ domain-containing protein [Planctomycetota bacterium]|nr:PilZ domain-containing protein [Planctomycetota bacterium]
MNRRKYKRVPLAFPLGVRIGDMDRSVGEHAINLSKGGIFVKMNCPPPVGTKVFVDFYLELVEKTIRAEGEVVRSVTEGAKGKSPSGMGVRFTELGEDGQQIIELSVQRFSKFRRKQPSMFLEVSEGLVDRVHAEIQATRAPRAKIALDESTIEKLNAELQPDPAPGAKKAPDKRTLDEVKAKIQAALAPGPKKSPGKMTLDFLIRRQGQEKLESRRGHTLRGRELFISADNPTPVGETVVFRVFLTQEERWASTTGKVVRHVYSDGSDGCPSGPGISVVVIEPSEEIRRILETSESESRSVKA